MKYPRIVGVLAAASAGLALSSVIPAQASVYGTLSNFDVFNNTPSTPYYGFEIELEGISLTDVPSYSGSYYTYPNWHYGSGEVSSYAGGVRVRYFDPANASAVTPPFVGAINPTDGHTCITINGCEHFGIALNSNPTATRYFWLDQGGNQTSQVNLLAPSWEVIQPAVPADPVGGKPAEPAVVRVEIEAPEVEPGKERSDAIWVRVFKRELEEPVPLDDLMADSDAVPDVDNAEPAEVEIEWKLFQRDINKENQNFLDNGGNGEEIAEGKDQVLRTYTFYTFAGTYNEEHEAVCTEVGNCEDLSDAEREPFIGALIGQQMAALNLDGAILAPPPQPVPVPAALPLFLSSLAAAGWLGRRRRSR